MKNKVESDTSDAENLSAFFDGVTDKFISDKSVVLNRKKWETYSLISDVMKKNYSPDLSLSNFSENLRSKILNEPKHSKYNFSAIANWFKYYYKKTSILVAAPAIAMGLFVVVVQIPTEQVQLADEGDMPKIMDSFCQLHENGTGGAALC